MEFWDYAPIVVVVVAVGWCWWWYRRCCAVVEEMRQWLAVDPPAGSGYSSGATWIQAAHRAICNLESFAGGNVLDPAERLCAGPGTDPTDPPKDPPPFA